MGLDACSNLCIRGDERTYVFVLSSSQELCVGDGGEGTEAAD